MNETRITELRKARGWTQERLAGESGVAVRTIQRLEAGQDASLDTLALIAKALDVPVKELFGAVENPEFQNAVEHLDDRQAAQQRRRDSTTRAYERLFTGIGFLVVITTTALALTGTVHSWLIWLVIPAYWIGGRYLFSALFRLLIDPRLDARFPLTTPTRVHADTDAARL